mgnify:CR=1 FL=1|tara:strand:+ start:624 stop:1037 length:414 start_codon:yes stop_codon:yes gene_type:complete
MFLCRFLLDGGNFMNVALAINTYNQNKTKTSLQNDGYEAVKYALKQVSESMERLQSYPNPEIKEKCTERALSSIYFLQKCLDFEKGGELAVQLFKVYEYCRKQIIQFSTVDSAGTLKQAILFINTIYEGWEGMKQTK